MDRVERLCDQILVIVAAARTNSTERRDFSTQTDPVHDPCTSNHAPPATALNAGEAVKPSAPTSPQHTPTIVTVAVQRNDLPPSKLKIARGEADTALQEVVRAMWNVSRGRAMAYNPSPHPTNLTVATLAALDPRDYLIAEKVDGVRYMLVLAMRAGKPVAFLMDRTCTKFVVAVLALPHHFEKGCAFDGELCTAPSGRSVYYVHDVACYDGDNWRTRSTTERHGLVMRVFADPFFNDYPGMTADRARRVRMEQIRATNDVILCNEGGTNCLAFCGKPMYACTDIDRIAATAHQRDLVSDGYILTPAAAALPTGTFWTQYKWKPGGDSTVDFELVATPETDGKWSVALMYVLADSTIPLSRSSERAAKRSRTSGDTVAPQQEVAVCDACEGIAYKPESCRTLEGRMLRARVDIANDPVLRTILDESTTKTVRCIVECRCNIEAGDILRCTVVRKRLDKSEPNGRFTISSTIDNIENPITLAMLRDRLLQSPPQPSSPTIAAKLPPQQPNTTAQPSLHLPVPDNNPTIPREDRPIVTGPCPGMPQNGGREPRSARSLLAALRKPTVLVK